MGGALHHPGGHGGGLVELFAGHLEQELVMHLEQHPRAQPGVGDRIRQGQQLGEMGNTGYSSEDHLHFSIFLNGAHVDPSEHLQ